MIGRDGRKIINFRPVLLFSSSLALGIGGAYAAEVHELPLAAFILVLLAAGVLLCALSGEIKNTPFILTAFLLAFGMGALSFRAQLNAYRKGRSIGGETSVVGTVEKIGLGDSYAVLTLGDLTFNGEERAGKLRLQLSSVAAQSLNLSDELFFDCEIFSMQTLAGEFRADLVSDDVRYVAYKASGLAVVGAEFNLFRSIANRLRGALQRGMDETTAAVTYALLTGESSGIDEGLLENVRRGGIAHIFAVSGLHIGALYAFLRLLIVKTGLKRGSKTTRFLFVAFILLFYSGVCGFSPSVLRAAIMCLATYLAELFGTKSDPLERLGFAALIVLLLDPASLFAIGFQLSFAAAAGILVFSRTLGDVMLAPVLALSARGDRGGENLSREEIAEKRLLFRFLQPAIGLLAVTLSAQIATAPFQLNAFGYLSGWGLLLNVLIVPLVGAVYSAVFLLAFLATVFPSGAAVLLFLPNAFISAVLLPFQSLSFSFSLFEGVRFSLPSAILYYALVSLLSKKTNLPRTVKATAFFVLLFALECTMYQTNGRITAFIQGKILQSQSLAFFWTL